MAIQYRPMSPSTYVAFTKATEALWAKMDAASRLDNTLYFIVDGSDDTIGKLYLGNTLIADGNGLTNMAISALTDVHISKINTGDVLMYDMTTQTWKNVNLASVIGDLIKVFEGATESSVGSSGLVPAPTIGDINHFLKGDGTWANPTEEVAQDLSDLTAVVNTLVGTDVGVSVATIATKKAQDAAAAAVTRILDGAPDAFDTLKEVATWIENHPKAADFTALSNRVTDVESILDGINGEPGLVSVVNTMKGNVSNLLEWQTAAQGSLTALQSNVSGLQSNLNALLESVGKNTDDIAELANRLVWHELFDNEI